MCKTEKNFYSKMRLMGLINIVNNNKWQPYLHSLYRPCYLFTEEQTCPLFPSEIIIQMGAEMDPSTD